MSEPMVGSVVLNVRKDVVVLEGEIVRVQILNSDGSVKSTEIDTQVMAGKKYTGSIVTFGNIDDAV